MASDPCTLTKVRSPESPASSSSAARPYSTALRPAQPYPDRCEPSRPSLPISVTSSAGNTAFSYQSLMLRPDALADEPPHGVAPGEFLVRQQGVEAEIIRGQGHAGLQSSGMGASPTTMPAPPARSSPGCPRGFCDRRRASRGTAGKGRPASCCYHMGSRRAIRGNSVPPPGSGLGLPARGGPLPLQPAARGQIAGTELQARSAGRQRYYHGSPGGSSEISEPSRAARACS